MTFQLHSITVMIVACIFTLYTIQKERFSGVKEKVLFGHTATYMTGVRALLLDVINMMKFEACFFSPK